METTLEINSLNQRTADNENELNRQVIFLNVIVVYCNYLYLIITRVDNSHF